MLQQPMPHYSPPRCRQPPGMLEYAERNTQQRVDDLGAKMASPMACQSDIRRRDGTIIRSPERAANDHTGNVPARANR